MRRIVPLPFAVVFALLLACAGALPALAVPVQAVTSPGGIKAWLVEDHNLPFVSLQIRFRGGTSLDAPGKRGAVELMAALLEEGSGGLDARGFAKARDALAADFDFDAGDDSVSVSARMLTENRDKAVALLHDALVRPRFDADAIARVKGQLLASIRQSARDPGTIAGNRLDSLAFGSHPYGSDDDGTVASVTALTKADLQAAHDATMARDRIYVAASGDITPAALGSLLDTLFAGLPATGAPQAPAAKDLLTGGVTVVPYDTPQSVILFAEEGLRRKDPDFLAAYALNEILGGNRFTARLMQEVRVKRGLTYGIGTALVPMDHAQLVMGQVASDNAKVAEVVKVVRQVWADTAANGVTQAELDAAKTYLIGAFPLRFDGNARIASILVGMEMDGIPMDYLTRRNDEVRALTLDDVNRVAKRLLKPDNLRFVVVGKPVGLETTN